MQQDEQQNNLSELANNLSELAKMQLLAIGVLSESVVGKDVKITDVEDLLISIGKQHNFNKEEMFNDLKVKYKSFIRN